MVKDENKDPNTEINENMKKNAETADNEINELDGDSLTGVAGGIKIGGLKEVPIPGRIGLKYGFPGGRPRLDLSPEEMEERRENIKRLLKKKLEEKLKDPNLSPEERKRIEGLLLKLKMYKPVETNNNSFFK